MLPLYTSVQGRTLATWKSKSMQEPMNAKKCASPSSLFF